MNWISVDERLPDFYQDVLLATSVPSIVIDHISNPADGNLWACTYNKLVTHWLPLPELPK